MSERIITSLDKGLQILLTLAETGSAISLADLSRRLPWDKSTIYRVLETLAAREFVALTESGYVLGRAAKRLGGTDGEQDTMDAARVIMQKLAVETQENAHLAVPAGTEVVFVDRASVAKFTLHTEIGGREPLHCTAVGKAYLMGLRTDELERLLHTLEYERFTPRTLGNAAELTADIERSRIQGYAEDDREYSDDVRCVAAPIFNAQGRVIVTVGVSGPASRVSTKQNQDWGLLCAKLARGISSNSPTLQHVGT